MVETAARFIALFTLVSLCLGSPAEAKRVALVIGNSNYKHWGKLDTTGNDAADMAAALKGFGFAVIEGTTDLDNIAMDRKVREFADALSGAEAGVFYYAGHAFQLNGVNYLVPVDAELKSEQSVDFETVRLDLVQRTMERATKTNILFLDACRDNPFVRNLAASMGTRSRSGAVGRGLALTEAGKGTLISYSTQPGNVAQDSVDLADKKISRNSPYTGALVKRIATASDDLASILTDVRKDVIAVTEERQIPWEHTSLTDKFWFKAPPAAPANTTTTPVASEAERAWGEIKGSTSPVAFEAFRKQFGAANPFYDSLAAGRIEALKQAKAKLDDQARSEAEARQKAEELEAKRKVDEAAAAAEAKRQDEQRVAMLPAVAPERKAAATTPAPSAPVTPEAAAVQQDLVTLTAIATSTDPTALEGFIKRYGADSPNGKMARLRLQLLKLGAPSAQPDASSTSKPEQQTMLVPPAPATPGPLSPSRPSDRSLKPGDTFRDCPACPEMVVVPAGEFMMGSPENEKGRREWEGPQHKVTIAEPFAVGKYEVTLAEWDACWSDDKCFTAVPKSYSAGKLVAGFARKPASGIHWSYAKAYIAWLSTKTGKPYRLLSEAEWEYAARAGTTTPYATGDTITTKQAYFNFNAYPNNFVDVGSFNPNAFGLYDLGGNVTEWVEDTWHYAYGGILAGNLSAPTDGSAWTADGIAGSRVLRGASGWFPPRSASRMQGSEESGFLGSNTDKNLSDVGIRMARPLTP